MKAEEIKSADDLAAWLNGLPEDQRMRVSQQINHRARLRVMPIWLQPNSRSMPVIGPLIISTVYLSGQNVNASSELFDFASKMSKDIENISANHAQRFSMEAAKFAALTAAASSALESSQAAWNAAAAAAASDAAASDAAKFLSETYQDAIYLENGVDIQSLPLWREQSREDQARWNNSQTLLKSHPAWSVFKDLYENALHARPQNWPLLTALAQKDEAFWTGTDTEVLDRIAEVMDNFERLRLLYETRAINGVFEEGLPAGAASAFQRSHNSPPELIEKADWPQQVLIIWAGLHQVEPELRKAKPNKALLAEIAEWMKKALLAFLRKCGDWADKGVSAFMIAFGAESGRIVANELFFNGRLAEYIEQLVKFASGG